MHDIRNWSKAELTNHIVKNKHNAWTLKEKSDAAVRAWAESKERVFLVDIIAGWNREELRESGLYLD